MRRASLWFLACIGLMLLLLAGAASWLLATESGLHFAVRQASTFGGEQFSLAQADGRLIGPLSIRSLRLETEAATITLDQARLEWSPRALFSQRIQIDALSGGILSVALKEAPDRPAAPPSPLPQPLVPFAVHVESAELGTLRITPPGADAFEAQALRLRAQLLGEHFRIEELRAAIKPAGPLHLVAQGRLLADGVELEQASLTGPGRVEAAGALHWIDPRADLTLNWNALHWPPGPTPEFDSTEGSLSIQGPFSALAVQGTLQLGEETQVELDGTAGDQLNISARWQALRWPLRGPAKEVSLRSPHGKLRLHGEISAPQFDAELALAPRGRIQLAGQWGETLRLNAHWQQLQWPLQGPAQAALIRSGQGEITLSGQPEQWQFRVNGDLAHADQTARLRAAGTGSMEGLAAPTLHLQALGGELKGSAQVDWGLARLAQAELSVKQLDPGRLLAGWSGDLNGRVTASVNWSEALSYTARWALLDSQLRQLPIRSEGQLKGEGDALRVSEVTVRSGESSASLDGQLTPKLQLQAKLDSPQLTDLWPELKGQMQLQADIRGDWRLPQLQAQGQAKDLQLATLRLGSGEFSASVDDSGVMDVGAKAQDLNVGYAFAEANLQISGHVSEHRIEIFADGEHGSGRMQLQGRYDAQQLSWDGELQQGALEPAVLAKWELEEGARLAVSPGSALLEPACWRSQDGRLCAQANWQAPELLLAWRLEALELAALQPLLPADWRAEGEVTGTGRLLLNDAGLADAEVDMQTTAGALAAGPKARLDFGPSRWQINESGEGAHILAHLALPDGALNLDAQIAPAERWRERALSGELQANWPDIGALALLSPELGDVQGALQGQFKLGGQIGKPRLQGQLSLADGQVHLQTPGITLRELQAELSAGADERIRMQASARSGDGRLQLDGQWALFETGRRVGLEIRGEQVLAINTPEAKVWVSPDLLLELEGESARLTGTVTVPRADITPERFSGGGVGPSADQVILDENGTRPTDGGLKLHSQVKLVLGDAVRFDGFGLKTRLSGQIEATDRPGRLTAGRGELRLVGGRYQAYGQDLTIETGRLLFDGGPITNPSLDLRATRKPREEILVGVQVRGPLNAPQLNLFSDPPMNQDAQLSWLVLGRPVGSGTDDAEREAVASAALALGLKGTDFVAGKLGTKLGLDEISVGSRPGETADQARFTIGKYLSPKLFVSYGVGLFQPGHSLQLEYDLGGGFKLFSETGVESGGDLIYTIEK